MERILRVPSGFMRNRTQERIEAMAAEREQRAIDLALVEEGIAIGRQLMEEMLRNEAAAQEAAHERAREAAEVSTSPPPAPTADVFADRQPPINEVGSPSALQARRAGGPTH